MGTSSLYKGPKSAALLPSDFTEDEENSAIGDLSSKEIPDSDSSKDDEQDKGEEQGNSEESKFVTTTYFQSAKRNFTSSFGGSTSKVKTAISGYVKALGGHKQATQQSKTARKVTGGMFYLLSGSPETVRKKFEDVGIPVMDVLSKMYSAIFAYILPLLQIVWKTLW